MKESFKIFEEFLEDQKKFKDFLDLWKLFCRILRDYDFDDENEEFEEVEGIVRRFKINERSIHIAYL